MSNLPGVNIAVQDFGLGILPELGEGIHVKIGVASGGVPGELYPITSRKSIQDQLISGPLAEACATALGEGAGLIYAMPVNASVAGTVTAGVATKTGTGNMVPSGNPKDAYEGVVEITKDGALGTAAFRYTLDGGDNWSAEIAVPLAGTYNIPDTGVVLTFTNGVSGTSFVKGDRYPFGTTAPSYTTTDLNAAFDALIANSQLRYRFIHVVGAATPTVGAAVKVKLAELEALFRYKRAYLEAADDTDSNLETAWALFESPRVVVSAGFAEVVSPLTGRVQRRSAGWLVAGRRGAVPVEEDAGRVASGGLKGVTRLYRDEFVTPRLDSARFTTLRTYPGLSGFFITQGKSMALPGSDFELDQYGLIMDIACEVAYTAGLRYVNESIRVDGKTGIIRDGEAKRIEMDIQAKVRSALKGKISTEGDGDEPAAYIKIDRSVDILATRQLVIDVGIVPLGYAKTITYRIGYRNPRTVAS
jgi:hypothetical protein